MPKGVLMISDTRQMFEFTNDISTDRARKITCINRNIFLGGAGSESNWHTAQILRNSLYNVTSNITGSNAISHILKIYRAVNQLHMQHHVNRDPVGEILISEYLPKHNKFNLHHNNGLNNFTSIKTLKEIKDVEVIGLNKQTQDHMKEIIKKELDKVSADDFNRNTFYLNLAEYCHLVFKASGLSSISKGVYCVYLSSLNGQPASDTFFIDEDGTYHKTSPLDSDKEIKF